MIAENYFAFILSDGESSFILPAGEASFSINKDRLSFRLQAGETFFKMPYASTNNTRGEGNFYPGGADRGQDGGGEAGR